MPVRHISEFSWPELPLGHRDQGPREVSVSFVSQSAAGKHLPAPLLTLHLASRSPSSHCLIRKHITSLLSQDGGREGRYSVGISQKHVDPRA